MNRRPRHPILRLAAAFLLALALAPATAHAQCTIGIYADRDGTDHRVSGTRDGVPFWIHVLIFVEDTVDAVAYSIDIPHLGESVFQINFLGGPDGEGIYIKSPNGISMGLGDCYPGFQGNPILVASYELLHIVYTEPYFFRLGPNVDSGGSAVYPSYSNCRGEIVACETVLDGEFCTPWNCPVATESRSFGALKALWGG